MALRILSGLIGILVLAGAILEYNESGEFSPTGVGVIMLFLGYAFLGIGASKKKSKD